MHHVALWPALPEMQNKLSKKRHSYSKQGAGSENIVTQMEEGGDLWRGHMKTIKNTDAMENICGGRPTRMNALCSLYCKSN